MNLVNQMVGRIVGLPLMVVVFEPSIYNAAAKNADDEKNFTWVDGYDGGLWGSHRVGKYYTAVVPPCGDEPDDKVRIHCKGNYCNVVTDRVSAGAAITLMVINHLVALLHEKNNPAWESLAELFHDLRDAVYDDESLDHAAIAQFLD